MSQWAFRSATELVKAIKDRKISSLELIEAYIDRKEQLDSNINAIVATDYDRARKRAKAADEALAKGEDWGVLHGLPMTIKDNLEVVGMPCTAGAPELKGYKPLRNADVVQRLISAGAIVFGKTNLPRYGDDWQTYNTVYGVTNNPWDPSRTPGGSSGGSAAAIATGFTGLEIGNDIGGSIRHPAHFCGIYGHKPTYGIVPDRGLIPPPPGLFTGDYTMQTDIVSSGPLSRSAEDLDLAMSIIVSAELPERIAWRIELPEPRKQKLSEYRIGLWLDDPACPVDSAVGNCLQSAVDALAKAGANISEKRPDIEFSQAFKVHYDLLNGAMSPSVPAEHFNKWIVNESSFPAEPDDYKTRSAKGAIQRHHHWLLRDLERQMMRQKWADFFTEFDVLLCPSTPVAAFPHDHKSFFDRTLVVNNVERPYSDLLGWAGLTNTFFLPSTVAPVGFTSNRLPVGIQIVGPYLEDRTPIHFAKLMAEVVGGFVPPEGF